MWQKAEPWELYRGFCGTLPRACSVAVTHFPASVQSGADPIFFDVEEL